MLFQIPNANSISDLWLGILKEKQDGKGGRDLTKGRSTGIKLSVSIKRDLSLSVLRVTFRFLINFLKPNLPRG